VGGLRVGGRFFWLGEAFGLRGGAGDRICELEKGWEGGGVARSGRGKGGA